MRLGGCKADGESCWASVLCATGIQPVRTTGWKSATARPRLSGAVLSDTPLADVIRPNLPIPGSGEGVSPIIQSN